MKCIHGVVRPGHCDKCSLTAARATGLPVVRLISPEALQTLQDVESHERALANPFLAEAPATFSRDFLCPDCGNGITVQSGSPLPGDMLIYCTSKH